MIIVCVVIGALGVLSAILGFAAEGTKLTPSDIVVSYYGTSCYYPPSPALGLGVCAAIFLLVTQITAAAVSGCCGFCKSRGAIHTGTKRTVIVVCAVFSWIATVIAWGLLIRGAYWNTNVVREAAGRWRCYYITGGIFATAGVFTLAATALSITSYIMLQRQLNAAAPAAAAAAAPAPKPEEQSPPAVIAMGTPQFPSPQGYVQPQHPNYPPQHPPQPPAAYRPAAAPNTEEHLPAAGIAMGISQFPFPQGYAQPQYPNYPPQYPPQPQEAQFPPTAPPPPAEVGMHAPHQMFFPPPKQV